MNCTFVKAMIQLTISWTSGWWTDVYEWCQTSNFLSSEMMSWNSIIFLLFGTRKLPDTLSNEWTYLRRNFDVEFKFHTMQKNEPWVKHIRKMLMSTKCLNWNQIILCVCPPGGKNVSGSHKSLASLSIFKLCAKWQKEA